MIYRLYIGCDYKAGRLLFFKICHEEASSLLGSDHAVSLRGDQLVYVNQLLIHVVLTLIPRDFLFFGFVS